MTNKVAISDYPSRTLWKISILCATFRIFQLYKIFLITSIHNIASWILNAAKLTKDDNQITLEELGEDLLVYASIQISWPSQSNINRNFYVSSWMLNTATVNSSNMSRMIIAGSCGKFLYLASPLESHDFICIFSSGQNIFICQAKH